jgi:hypothetical protein
MSFPGISSSLAGAEPGRSGFPASITSLLDYPPAPRMGGLFGPLSGGASRQPGASSPDSQRGWQCQRRMHLQSAAAWKADTLSARGRPPGFTGPEKAQRTSDCDRDSEPSVREGLVWARNGSSPHSRSSARPALDLSPLFGGASTRDLFGKGAARAERFKRRMHLQSAAAWKADTHEKAEADTKPCPWKDGLPKRVGKWVLGRPSSRSSARPALDLPTGGLIPVGFCLSHLPRRADLQPRAGGFCGAAT